ncbi:Calcineurin-like phosphoesterase domain-containing protein [[Candida] zeylanoides]
MRSHRTISQLLVTLALCWLSIFVIYERYVPYSNARACSWPEIKYESQDEPSDKVVVDQAAANDVAPAMPKGDSILNLRNVPHAAAAANAPEAAAAEAVADGAGSAGVADTEPNDVEPNKPGEPYRGVDSALIMFIADPQLIDAHTYPGRNSLLLKLSQHTVDTYLRKNYKALMNALTPEHVFFLGDLLDNGRSVDDAYFQHELARFHSIFPRHPDTYTFHTNVPGNHDIGYGDGVKVPSRDRFEESFGQTNTIYEICEVQFIILDSPSLASTKEEINKKSHEFLDHVASIPKAHPRVLLTHVPLFRDPSQQQCGPLRESSQFHLSAGYQYQSALNADVTQEILSKVQPDLVFTGDDHDYCDVMHGESVREITVKSISMAMGIKYPAVQLFRLVLEKESNQVHYETQICYLPTPYVNVAIYAVMAIISGVLILWWDIRQRPPLAARYSSLATSDAGGSAGDPAASNTAIKLSNFLRGQDEDSVNSAPLPSYTFTQAPKPATTLSRCNSAVQHFLWRWNLVAFAKHASMLATFVVCLYAAFQWTI